MAEWAWEITYTLATTASTTATATARTATATSGLAAAGTIAGTLTVGALGLLSRLGLAGELDGDLALEDLLAGELSDGALSLVGCGKVDESIADRAVGTRVLRDGNGLTVQRARGVSAAAHDDIWLGGIAGGLGDAG